MNSHFLLCLQCVLLRFHARAATVLCEVRTPPGGLESVTDEQEPGLQYGSRSPTPHGSSVCSISSPWMATIVLTRWGTKHNCAAQLSFLLLHPSHFPCLRQHKLSSGPTPFHHFGSRPAGLSKGMLVIRSRGGAPNAAQVLMLFLTNLTFHAISTADEAWLPSAPRAAPSGDKPAGLTACPPGQRLGLAATWPQACVMPPGICGEFSAVLSRSCLGSAGAVQIFGSRRPEMDVYIWEDSGGWEGAGLVGGT